MSCSHSASQIVSLTQASDHGTLASCFWHNALEHGAAPAFVLVDQGQSQVFSWRRIGELVSQVAAWLADLRQDQADDVACQPNHIASCLPNGLPWIVLDLAAQTLGMVHVAIDVAEPFSRQQELLRFSESRWLLHAVGNSSEAEKKESEQAESWRGVEVTDSVSGSQLSLPDCLQPYADRGDMQLCQSWAKAIDSRLPAQMLFTSGSEGTAKGVMLSHRNLLSNALAKLDAAPQYTRDFRLNLLPFSHAYARTCELSTWILSRSQLAVARDWSDLVEQARACEPTLINLVPYLAARAADALDQDPYCLGSRLRLLQVGGAALPDELWSRLDRHGLPPLQGYGLTEASPVVCSNRAGTQRAGTVGTAVAGVETRIDEHRVLWCRGPGVMLGYWKDPTGTAAAVQAGWLRTGDLAEQNEQGQFTIVGRNSQQLVLSTGYKVAPEPIERILQAQDWLEQAILVGHGRPFVVALLWPSAAFRNLATVGSQQAEPAQQRALLARRIEQCLPGFPRHAVPWWYAWLPSPLSQEQGTLTRKGAPRREAIVRRYQHMIDELYARATNTSSPTRRKHS
jgi:long-chain acyl-CoA synthetase